MGLTRYVSVCHPGKGKSIVPLKISNDLINVHIKFKCKIKLKDWMVRIDELVLYIDAMKCVINLSHVTGPSKLVIINVKTVDDCRLTC